MGALFLAIDDGHYVAADCIARVERYDDGSGRLHMKDGSVLPLLPAEVEPVLNAIRCWCHETDQQQLPYRWDE